MHILVTNDDGYMSEGIALLRSVAAEFGTVTVVAPDRQQSATSHALTLGRPLRAMDVAPGIFAVDGTPTDCVNLALNGLLPVRPELVLSGVNHGGNLGDDITYSGTVSAAMEGCLLGVPSVALSYDDFRPSPADWEALRPALQRMIAYVCNHRPGAGRLYNVNFPRVSVGPRGCRITVQGKRVYGDAIVANTDPRGYPYYWIGGNVLQSDTRPGTDLAALAEGYVSLTPVHLDLTDHGHVSELNQRFPVELAQW